MAKYLRMVCTFDKGSRRTISFLNPKTGLTQQTITEVFEKMYEDDVFDTLTDTGELEKIANLIEAYYEETVITPVIAQP